MNQNSFELPKLTSENFQKILECRLELIKSVLGHKHKEYAVNDDYLVNFTDGARFDNTTPELTLWGYLKKQLVSVMKMAKNSPHQKYSRDFVSEKIGDCINYLILLEAIMICRDKDTK